MKYTVNAHKKKCANKIKNRIYCTPVNQYHKYQIHTKEQKI